MNKIIRIEERSEQYDLARKVIGLAMKVHSTLHSGFLEVVYRNALGLELRRAELKVEAERPISVATGIDEGLLLNFGTERLEFKKKFRRPKQEAASF